MNTPHHRISHAILTSTNYHARVMLHEEARQACAWLRGTIDGLEDFGVDSADMRDLTAALSTLGDIARAAHPDRIR